ncbi:hypothetical protein KM043_015662 [Ampulex compressa]|nr:hypothetical protein KM043_015662 [Ampulex compressa]
MAYVFENSIAPSSRQNSSSYKNLATKLQNRQQNFERRDNYTQHQFPTWRENSTPDVCIAEIIKEHEELDVLDINSGNEIRNFQTTSYANSQLKLKKEEGGKKTTFRR